MGSDVVLVVECAFDDRSQEPQLTVQWLLPIHWGKRLQVGGRRAQPSRKIADMQVCGTCPAGKALRQADTPVKLPQGQWQGTRLHVSAGDA